MYVSVRNEIDYEQMNSAKMCKLLSLLARLGHWLSSRNTYCISHFFASSSALTLSDLETEKATVVLWGICKGSPVIGLRPVLALLIFCLKLPNSFKHTTPKVMLVHNVDIKM